MVTNKPKKTEFNLDKVDNSPSTSTRKDHLPPTSDHIPTTSTVPINAKPALDDDSQDFNSSNEDLLDIQPDDETTGRGQLSPLDIDTRPPYPPGVGGENNKKGR